MIFYSMGVYTQVCLVYPQCSGVPPGVPTPVWPHRPFTNFWPFVSSAHASTAIATA